MEEKFFINAVPRNRRRRRHRRSQDVQDIELLAHPLTLLGHFNPIDLERDSQRSVMNCKSMRKRRTVSGSSAPLRLALSELFT